VYLLYLLYVAGAGWVNGGFYPFERDKACILSGNKMKIHDDLYPYAWNHAFSIEEDRV
jgi:hypothetical protein